MSYPQNFLLSVVIPVFNEESTVEEIIHRVRETNVPTEVIVVDDGSTDNTNDILTRLAITRDIRLVTHASNLGKGAAVRSGCSICEGDIVVVQDADLEYDPSDFEMLLEPILADKADVVYGSRYAYWGSRPDGRFHRWGNRLITFLSNRSTGLRLTDVETCYKALRQDVAKEFVPRLREDGFGIEIELTSKLAKRGLRIVEVPIKYDARGYSEGKKIGLRDGLRALWCIFRY